VSQHHGGGEDHGSGVRLVTSLNVQSDVTTSGLENGVLTSHVGTGNDTGSSDKGGSNVGQDRSVQVGHDENVELLGTGDSLHGGVVDNHVVDLKLGVLGSNLVEGAAEETVGKLHDVGLVDTGDLLAVVGSSEGEGELGDTLGLHLGDDLEGLNDTGNGLVLETRVLSLGVLTNDAHVNVGVAGGVSGHVLNHDDGRIDVELLTESYVEGLVSGTLDGGVEDS
jgi:hypothetical protein